ncbi:MAG: glycosyltransferase family 4 protein [Candidatus Latescibacteria bacterium]|nr:glycosyltransferase family 4 protein [Candidatus Latescibacterota bacterium]
MVTNLFYPLTGGSENVVFETSRRLARRGHTVRVLTEQTRPQWPLYEEVDGIHIHRCRVRFGNGPIRFGSGVINAARLFKHLIAHVPVDVVHFHLTLPALGVLLCRESRPLAKVATFHGPWDEEERAEKSATRGVALSHVKAWLFGLLQRRVLQSSQRVIVLSQFSRQAVMRFVRATGVVEVIPGGADVERFQPAVCRQQVKARLRLPVDEPVLLTVRRLVPRMGIEALVGALPAMLSHGRRVTLVIGGDGPLRPLLERQAADLGVGERVRFAGFIPDDELPSYYQAADVFVMPTRTLEGFGLSTVEALACGTPVIGTAVGATAEILNTLDRRLLIPESSPAAIARTALACLDSDLVEPAFRARCRAYVEDRYTWDRAVDALERVYDAATQEHRVH